MKHFSKKNFRIIFLTAFSALISFNLWAFQEPGSKEIKKVVRPYAKGLLSWTKGYFNPNEVNLEYGPDFINLSVNPEPETKTSKNEVSKPNSPSKPNLSTDSLSKMAFEHCYNAVLNMAMHRATSAIASKSGLESYSKELNVQVNKAIDESSDPKLVREVIPALPTLNKLKQIVVNYCQEKTFQATHPHVEGYLDEKGVFKKADTTITDIQKKAIDFAERNPLLIAGGMATFGVGTASYKAYDVYSEIQKDFTELKSALNPEIGSTNYVNLMLKLNWHIRERYKDVRNIAGLQGKED